jgi:trimeric autotransporter adhesin
MTVTGRIALQALIWRRAAATVSLLGLLLVPASCRETGTEPTGPVFGALELISESNLTGAAGEALAPPVVVRARDTQGQPMAGVEIVWTAAAGTVNPASSSTDASGIAAVTWTLGPATGQQQLTAAADGRTVTVTAQAQPGAPHTVTITPASVVFGALGETATLAAGAVDQFGNPTAGSVTWSSLAPDVAEIDLTGLVRAVAPGTAGITATIGTAVGSAVIDVQQQIVRVRVSSPWHTFSAIGDTHRFSATALDANDRPVVGAPLAWSSADPGIVTVDETGLARAVAAGSTLLLATSNGAADTVRVTVAQVAASIVIAPAAHTFSALGATQQFTAVVTDQNGNVLPGAPLTWTSSDPGVATVTSGGLVQAVAAGTTQITVSSGAVSAAATVVVTPAIASIEISPAAHTFTSLGDTQQFTAVARDANGNPIPGAPLAWSSTDGAVVTVTGGGLAESVGDGSAQIIVTSGAASDAAAVTVDRIVASVEISPAAHTFTSIGETQQFSAIARDANGNPIAGAPLTWSSTDAGVATVTAGGLAEAVGDGSAQIVVTSGAAADTAAVDVDRVIDSIEVSPATHTFTSLGDTEPFSAVARDANGNPIPGVAFTWSSTDTDVVSVTAGGVAEAVGDGSAQIIATSGSVAGAADIDVSRVAATLEISPTAHTFTSIEDTQQFSAVARDANANVIPGAALVWTSTDTNVVTITAGGLAEAAGDGTAEIIVTSGAAADTATVEVDRSVASVTVVPATASIDVGETAQFTAEARDANGFLISGVAFVWSSTDAAIATVDQTGLATAVNPSVAGIVATTGALADTAMLVIAEQARGFDGATQAILIADDPALTFPAGDWTLSLWVRPEDLSGTFIKYYFSWGIFAALPSMNLFLGEQGASPPTWGFNMRDAAGNGASALTTVTPIVGQWQHVLFMRSGNVVSFHIDGVEVPQTITLTGAIDVAGPVNLGRRSDADANRYFNGHLAQLGRWSRALTAPERNALAAGLNPRDITDFDFVVPLGHEPERSFGATFTFTPLNAPPVVAGPPVDPPSN